MAQRNWVQLFGTSPVLLHTIRHSAKQAFVRLKNKDQRRQHDISQNRNKNTNNERRQMAFFIFHESHTNADVVDQRHGLYVCLLCALLHKSMTNAIFRSKWTEKIVKQIMTARIPCTSKFSQNKITYSACARCPAANFVVRRDIGSALNFFSFLSVIETKWNELQLFWLWRIRQCLL